MWCEGPRLPSLLHLWPQMEAQQDGASALWSGLRGPADTTAGSLSGCGSVTVEQRWMMGLLRGA